MHHHILDFIFPAKYEQSRKQGKSQAPADECISLHPLAQYHNLVCVRMSKRRSLKQIKADRLMEVVYSFFLRTG